MSETLRERAMAAVEKERKSELERQVRKREARRAERREIYQREKGPLIDLVERALQTEWRFVFLDPVSEAAMDSGHPHDWLPTVTIDGMRFGRRTDGYREWLVLFLPCRDCRQRWLPVCGTLPIGSLCDLGLVREAIDAQAHWRCQECEGTRDWQ